MKKSDLHREWARVIDMCEGTDVDPRECLKMYNSKWLLFTHPTFDDNPECYTFAVAIIEGKPLFFGDEVYWKDTGEKFEWYKGLLENAEDYQERLTRTRPARTITLNGEKLPAPDDGNFYLCIGSSTHNHYGFKSDNDRVKVEAAINKLLRGE